MNERWLNVLVRNLPRLSSTQKLDVWSAGKSITVSLFRTNGKTVSHPSNVLYDWCIIYNMYDHFACTHNIGSCIMYWGCLNMMMVQPAISISHPAETMSFHFEWLAFERARSKCLTVTASAGFDPRNRGGLTQPSSLTAKIYLSTKTHLFTIRPSLWISCDFTGLYFDIFVRQPRLLWDYSLYFCKSIARLASLMNQRVEWWPIWRSRSFDNSSASHKTIWDSDSC